MNKLIKAEPVRLTLEYDNGHIIEFNVNSLVSLRRSFSGGIIGSTATNELEIVLEYEEELRHDTEILALNE